MTDSTAEHAPSFPTPVRLDGYFAWTWRLFRACFVRLVTVFVAGAAAAALVYIALVLFILYVLDAAANVEAQATVLAAQVLFFTVFGTLVAAIASPVFVEQLAGTRVGADVGWRRLRPRFGHVVISALYVAMPLLTLVLFLGQLTHFLLLPALLGPPVLVQAIVWEGKDFREAAVRAKDLLTGSWSRVLSALLVLALAPALVQILVLPLLGEFLPGLTATDLAGQMRATIVVAVTSSSVWLFTSAAGTVAYLDLRARSEELDREGLAAEAAAPAPTPS